MAIDCQIFRHLAKLQFLLTSVRHLGTQSKSSLSTRRNEAVPRARCARAGVWEASTRECVSHTYALLRDAMESDGGCDSLDERVTIVLTTSPCISLPSTRCIEEVLASIADFGGLKGARKIIVCDGVKCRDVNKFRSGVVTKEARAKYEVYLQRLMHLTQTQGPLYGAELLRLEERHGFGHALKRGIMRVVTPYVLVCQHDRSFRRRVRMSDVVKVMDENPDSVSYVGFATKTTLQHDRHILSYDLHVERRRFPELELELVPLIQWYDSMHLARTSYYISKVYGMQRFSNLSLGGFLEDTIGQVMLAEIREQGVEAHAHFGTFIVEDTINSPTVGHIDSHDPKNAGEAVKFMFATQHTSDDAWSAVDISEYDPKMIETLPGTGHWSERKKYLDSH